MVIAYQEQNLKYPVVIFSILRYDIRTNMEITMLNCLQRMRERDNVGTARPIITSNDFFLFLFPSISPEERRQYLQRLSDMQHIMNIHDCSQSCAASWKYLSLAKYDPSDLNGRRCNRNSYQKEFLVLSKVDFLSAHAQ